LIENGINLKLSQHVQIIDKIISQLIKIIN